MNDLKIVDFDQYLSTVKYISENNTCHPVLDKLTKFVIDYEQRAFPKDDESSVSDNDIHTWIDPVTNLRTFYINIDDVDLVRATKIVKEAFARFGEETSCGCCGCCEPKTDYNKPYNSYSIFDEMR